MRSVAIHYWIAVALLVAALPLPGLLAPKREVPLQRPLNELAYDIGDWHGHDQHMSERVRAILGTDDILLRAYEAPGGHAVGLYVSYFPRQLRGELSHSPQHCLPGAGWQLLSARYVPYPLGADGARINELLYEKDGQRLLVLYWFRERERIVASEYLVKWYLMWDAMTRGRTDGALLRISTPVLGSEAAAHQRCLDFMRATLPRLNELFPD